MSKRLALVFGVGAALLIAARFWVGDRAEAWLAASGAVICLAGMVTGLVIWAAMKRSENARDVGEGRYLWAARVREVRPGGSWGITGRLTVARDGTTSLEPDRDSLRRGAKGQTWPPGQIQITHVAHKRDITGISFDLIELNAPGYETRRFGVFAAAGTRPA